MTQQKSSIEPQNERELYFKLDGKLEKLIFAIDNLTETFKDWKTKEFAKIEIEVEELLNWKNQEVGKWKALTIGIGVLTLISLYLAIKNATK